MTQTSAPGLVPPCRNLGPEPWSEARPLAWGLIVGGALAALLLTWLVASRLRLARPPGVGRNRSLSNPHDDSPRGRLVALSNSMRDVLANQFGAGWRAKTTEELSAEVRLLEALGREQLQELIRFFDQVDRVKFAPERSNNQHDSLELTLNTWEPRLAELEKKIRARREGRRKIRTGDFEPAISRAELSQPETAGDRSRSRTKRPPTRLQS